jgi:DNA repair protein SbcD/Mre11
LKIITFTDIHLADKNPISRKDDYKESIFNKLEQIKDICEEKKVDLAICAGDIFHIKTPTKNSHQLVSQLVMLFKSFPCPVVTIYGNHDVTQNNIINLPRQPYFTLIKSEACIDLEDITYENVRIFKVDGLAEIPYTDFNRERKDEKIQICVAHVNASSKFSDLFGERVYTYQELEKTSPDIFVFGHYHPDQGIEIRNGKHFINVGSISRGSLSKDDLNRIPSIGYIEINENYEIKTSKIKLNVLDASEIFDLELKEQEESTEIEMQNFITELKGQNLFGDSEDIRNQLSSLNFERDIVERVLFYFDQS